MVPSPYMVKTTVYLDEETVARLREMSAQQQRPQAEIIRTILRDGTKVDRPRVSPNWGRFSSGQSDGSMRVKELVGKAILEKFERKRSGVDR